MSRRFRSFLSATSLLTWALSSSISIVSIAAFPAPLAFAADGDLRATFELPPQINRGADLDEFLGVENLGTTTVSSSTISQTFPAGFVFNSALSSTACSAIGNTVTCNVVSLAPNHHAQG
jgi:hypothetical protein